MSVEYTAIKFLIIYGFYWYVKCIELHYSTEYSMKPNTWTPNILFGTSLLDYVMKCEKIYYMFVYGFNYRPKCSAIHPVLTAEKKSRAIHIGHFIIKAHLDNICLVFCIKTHYFTYGFTVLYWFILISCIMDCNSGIPKVYKCLTL